ncbi:hypothetical protein QE109_17405 [Fusibacter bizertensis]|uniref:Uncharacterized protein n=1 Tax=Fusibacter bizertensis TaxID=1488331 RepID=A0ABT6NHL6_9FIRM|nr:ABC-three component system middle component 7 [Fusibacter bizertensis]MDH8679928.1 hypothetical protein [Fusibacter bizertensis]
MIFPNKVTSYEQSVLSKLPVIIKEIHKGELSIFTLYELTKSHFEEINEFVFALDVLFLLDVIDGIEGDYIHVEADK